MAITIMENPEAAGGIELPEREKSRLYLFGGDDYVQDPGYGGYRNDVWYTTGESEPDCEHRAAFVNACCLCALLPWSWGARESRASRIRNSIWKPSGLSDCRLPRFTPFAVAGSAFCTVAENVAVNSVVDTNQFGAALPRIASQTSWIESLDQVPPTGIGYKEWLCCLPGVYWECSFVSCEPLDPFEGQRRWSPRRDHAAVTVRNSKMFVMGGRSRALEDIPADEAIGGIIPPRGRWRERSLLLSDVWLSTDGEAWTMITPGCYVHQPGIIPNPGRQIQQCRTTSDCWIARLGATRCNDGVCECTMWSPREQFAAAAVDADIYVMGGRTYLPLQACGQHRCGTEYSRFLDDAWKSADDGRTWEQIKPMGNGQWAPRCGHSIAIADGAFWLVAGRGGSPTEYESNPLFNDVWRSTDGATWSLNVSSAPWAPRTNAQLVASATQLVLIGGAVQVFPSPSPSPLPPAGQVAAAAALAPVRSIRAVEASPPPQADIPGETVSGIRLFPQNDVWVYELARSSDAGVWLEDFRPGTPQASYQGLNTTISRAFNLSDTEASAMAAVGITTSYTLATATGDQVRALRTRSGTPAWPHPDEGPREACFYLKWAQSISERCETIDRPFDGEFIRTTTIVEGSVAAVALQSGATVDSLVNQAQETTTLQRLETDELLGGATGCGDRADFIIVAEDATDVVCKELFTPRFSHSAGEMDGRLYVAGGYIQQSVAAADTWYRDSQIPSTAITLAPRSGTSESVFEFAASEEACIYEWRIFEVGAGLVKASTPGTGTEVRNWSKQLPPVDIVSFIYSGDFRVEVRALDPAGNRDVAYRPGFNTYAFTWVAPIPWGWIILGIFLGILALFLFVYYYRRYRRRKAMERYAMKRIQRKIAAVQEGDWRNAYDKKKKKKKKGSKTKKREERERRRTEGGKDDKRKRKEGDKKKKTKSKKKKSGEAKKKGK